MGGDPTEYAKYLVSEIRKYSKRQIWYRPKPSWRDAMPIEGTYFSRHKKIAELQLRVNISEP